MFRAGGAGWVLRLRGVENEAGSGDQLRKRMRGSGGSVGAAQRGQSMPLSVGRRGGGAMAEADLGHLRDRENGTAATHDGLATKSSEKKEDYYSVGLRVRPPNERCCTTRGSNAAVLTNCLSTCPPIFSEQNCRVCLGTRDGSSILLCDSCERVSLDVLSMPAGGTAPHPRPVSLTRTTAFAMETGVSHILPQSPHRRNSIGT